MIRVEARERDMVIRSELAELRAAMIGFLSQESARGLLQPVRKPVNSNPP